MVRNSFNLLGIKLLHVHNSKAIVSTMRAFEKFILSFGLARFVGLRVAPRAFSVLDTSDSDVVNF